MAALINLIGQTVGQWTVLARSTNKAKGNHILYICRCSCGVEKDVQSRDLLSKSSLKCLECAKQDRENRYIKIRNLPTKKCPSCGKIFPRSSEFFHNHPTKGRLGSYCKACASKVSYVTRYKFSRDQKEILFKEQGSVCAACGSCTPNHMHGWSLDHDHKTGKIRGVLCFSCNVALGAVQDSPDKLAKLIAYLKRAA